MKTIKVLALCTLLPIGFTQPVSAAEPKLDIDVGSIVDVACKDDIKKFCPDAEKGKTNSCLKKNDKELSTECKGARMALDFLRKAAK